MRKQMRRRQRKWPEDWKQWARLPSFLSQAWPPVQRCSEVGLSGRWLDHAGSDLTAGVIHSWIYNPMCCWEVMELRRWGLVKGSGCLRTVLSQAPFCLARQYFLCSLVVMKWAVSSSICSWSHDALPRPKGMGPADHKLNPLKLWAGVKLSSFELFISGILSQRWKAS